jgi:hypothetical protein
VFGTQYIAYIVAVGGILPRRWKLYPRSPVTQRSPIALVRSHLNAGETQYG